MIIQNNFNKDTADPRSDYQKIGKGTHSLDAKFDLGNKYIRENMDNKVVQDVISSDHEYNVDETENKGDKWDFFR